MSLSAQQKENLRDFGAVWSATLDVDKGRRVLPREILSKPLKELACSVCMDNPLEPWQLPCQHILCFECLEQGKNYPHCPECRGPKLTAKKSRPLSFVVQSLVEYRCWVPDCTWVGKFAEMRTHWSKCTDINSQIAEKDAEIKKLKADKDASIKKAEADLEKAITEKKELVKKQKERANQQEPEPEKVRMQRASAQGRQSNPGSSWRTEHRHRSRSRRRN